MTPLATPLAHPYATPLSEDAAKVVAVLPLLSGGSDADPSSDEEDTP